MAWISLSAPDVSPLVGWFTNDSVKCRTAFEGATVGLVASDIQYRRT
jgi:hypothetical protein